MAPSLSVRMTSFIDGVLRLEPKLTAFDCDGTLWSAMPGRVSSRGRWTMVWYRTT